jgi:hypothetical protein
MCVNMTNICTHRHTSDTDTVSTDDQSWGGMGKYEYSQKALPHALVHAVELVMSGGHHGAYCTSVAETGHKVSIKLASRFARTYASRNESQGHMLEWVLRQKLWNAVLVHNMKTHPELFEMASNAPSAPELTPSPASVTRTKLLYPLHCTKTFSQELRIHGLTRQWKNRFLSKDVLITRNELLTMLSMN